MRWWAVALETRGLSLRVLKLPRWRRRVRAVARVARPRLSPMSCESGAVWGLPTPPLLGLERQVARHIVEADGVDVFDVFDARTFAARHAPGQTAPVGEYRCTSCDHDTWYSVHVPSPATTLPIACFMCQAPMVYMGNNVVVRR